MADHFAPSRVSILVSSIILGAALAAPRSVLDGVYSPDQAARGQKIYNSQCARCHGGVWTEPAPGPPFGGRLLRVKAHGPFQAGKPDLAPRGAPTGRLQSPGDGSHGGENQNQRPQGAPRNAASAVLFTCGFAPVAACRKWTTPTAQRC